MQQTPANVASSTRYSWKTICLPFLDAARSSKRAADSTLLGSLQSSQNQLLALLPRRVVLALPKKPLGFTLAKLRWQPGGQTRDRRQILKSFKTKDSHREQLGGCLAGTSVARSEIPIATTEIHTPSMTLDGTAHKLRHTLGDRAG